MRKPEVNRREILSLLAWDCAAKNRTYKNGLTPVGLLEGFDTAIAPRLLSSLKQPKLTSEVRNNFVDVLKQSKDSAISVGLGVGVGVMLTIGVGDFVDTTTPVAPFG